MINNAFLSSFILIFLSELFDKTQLLIFSLGIKYKSKLQVFLGSLSAHVIMDLAAIMLGFYISIFAYANIIKLLVGISFIFLGLFSLREEEEHKKNKTSKNAFLSSFFLVFASEFGDKTQFSSGLLAANYKSILPILLGVVLALSLAIAINLFLGKKLASLLPEKYIKFSIAIMFIIFGILIII